MSTKHTQCSSFLSSLRLETKWAPCQSYLSLHTLETKHAQYQSYFLCSLRLETECSHYRMIADEAYKQLMEIQGRGILSRSLDVQLRDWLELMEEVGLAAFCLIQTCKEG